MAKKLNIASVGSGIPIVFIHGWGLNSGVWQPSVELLKDKYQVITVDLPGFGSNTEFELSPYSVENIARHIHQTINKPTVYVGWSLGGLIATEIAHQFASSTLGLVTVASSPYFVKEENWPGIEPNVLGMFYGQLEQNTERTINNFLKIQAMGSPHIRQDIKTIRDLVMQYPMPSKETLSQSLAFLEHIDQRTLLGNISPPFLRLYGRLDGLVPKSVVSKVDHLASGSQHIIFEHSSHAPFISELPSFTSALSEWVDEYTL